MGGFNITGLHWSRSREVAEKIASKGNYKNPVAPRVGHLGRASLNTGFHVLKIVARCFSLVNRTVGLGLGIVGTVLTVGQNKTVRNFTARQGILLGSTVARLVVTPFQLVTHVAGTVLGFIMPKTGSKMMAAALKVDRVFDQFDVRVEDGEDDMNETLEKADSGVRKKLDDYVKTHNNEYGMTFKNDDIKKIFDNTWNEGKQTW